MPIPSGCSRTITALMERHETGSQRQDEKSSRVGRREEALQRFFLDLKPTEDGRVSEASLRHALRDRDPEAASIAIAVIGGGLPRKGPDSLQSGMMDTQQTAADANDTERLLTYTEFVDAVTKRARTAKQVQKFHQLHLADLNFGEAHTPPAMERNLFLSALANGTLAHHRDDVIITVKRIVAGGLSGMLAKSVVAPVDRIKILFQVTNEAFSFAKVKAMGRKIVAIEGVTGLWRGNSATMIRVFPYAGTQFMMFDTLKRFILERKGRADVTATRLTSMESLLAGSFAGGISAFVTYPLDLARARLAVTAGRRMQAMPHPATPVVAPSQHTSQSVLQTQPQQHTEQHPKRPGVFASLRTLVREEGYRSLYRGVVPSLVGIIPYAGIAFTINERAKHEVRVMTGKEPETLHKLGIGAFAGLIAQSCTYPLEVVRRRMQTAGMIDAHCGINQVFETKRLDDGRVIVQAKPGVAPQRPGIVSTLQTVLNEQGARGLFKGLSMNWVKGPLGISISFTSFDFLKRQFGI